ncbi:MAG: carboxymuconolactone decarboxylase family protein [Dehalococcoidales bacterium]|nr:carboxymuconolactone decarboxylase family protein [Dehalococcoidales bacterium]
MPKDAKAILKDLQQGTRSWRAAHPDCMPAFAELTKAAMKPGALDVKTKELIASAVGLAARCDYCIVHHVYESFKAGATRQELIETACVANFMGGGPVVTYTATLFIDAINAFAPEFGQ